MDITKFIIIIKFLLNNNEGNIKRLYENLEFYKKNLKLGKINNFRIGFKVHLKIKTHN